MKKGQKAPMQNNKNQNSILIDAFRAVRKGFVSDSARKRIMSVLVFLSFVTYNFMIAVPVEASNCPTGADITLSADCDWLPGTHNYTGTLTINGDVTVSAGSSGAPGQVIVNAENVVINGTVSANGLGNGTDSGTGAGISGGTGTGGGYGGNGGTDYYSRVGGLPYGFVTAPSDLGSGGGTDTNDGPTPGTAGGGALKLAVSGTLTLDGTVSADGIDVTAQDAGAGSGGSVWISASTIGGSGTVTANGGGSATRSIASGGGGRIAVTYASGSTSLMALSALGGTSIRTYSWANMDGGAGTVYVKADAAPYGNLYMTNSGTTYGKRTDMVASSSVTVDNFIMSNGAKLNVPTGTSLTVDTGALSGSGSPTPTLDVQVGGGYILANGATASGVTVTDVNPVIYTYSSSNSLNSASPPFGANTDVVIESGATVTVTGTSIVNMKSLDLQLGGTLNHADNSTEKTNIVNFHVIGDATIDGTINVNTLGYDKFEGPGVGGQSSSARGGGGGYGGRGAYYDTPLGGVVYGSVVEPVDLGSGGHWSTSSGYQNPGDGGGAVKLVVDGTLDIDGSISAIGGAGGYRSGGGSGGSIWVDAGTIGGAGTVTVEGGSGMYVGAVSGSGGRAAVYWGAGSVSSLNINAYGGNNTEAYNNIYGSAGTVYLHGPTAVHGDLVIDNNEINQARAVSTEPVVGSSETYDNVYIKKAAKYVVVGTNTMTVPSGGVITGSGTTTPKLTINSGGTLVAPEAAAITGVTLTNDGTLIFPQTVSVSLNPASTTSGGTVTVSGSVVTDSSPVAYQSMKIWRDASLIAGSAVEGGTLSYENQYTSGVYRMWLYRKIAPHNTDFIHVGRTTTCAIASRTYQTHWEEFVESYVDTTNGVVILLQKSKSYCSGGQVASGVFVYDLFTGEQVYASTARLLAYSLFTTTSSNYYRVNGTMSVNEATHEVTVTYDDATVVTETYSVGSVTDAIFTDASGNYSYEMTAPAEVGSYTIKAESLSGGINYDDTASLSVAGGDTTPPVVSSVSCSGQTESGFTVTWTTDEASSTLVDYDTDTGVPYANTATGTSGVTSHSKAVTGLSASTTYYYRVRSVDAATNEAASSESTCATTAPATTEVPEQVTISGTQPPVSGGNPSTVSSMSISPTISDPEGVKQVELLLDGAVYHTCSYSSPYPTSPTCTYSYGTLPRGVYVLGTRTTDANDAVTLEESTLTVAGFTTENDVTASRNAAGATGVDFQISFELAGTSGAADDLIIEFPAGFTVISVGTHADTSACITGLTMTDSDTVTGTKSSCPGNTTLVVAGMVVDLPSVPGEYIISWSNDYGGAPFYLNDNDQVTVSSNVDPSISFNVGATDSCDHTFSGNGGTVALGTLTPTAVTSSDASGVYGVCTRMSHNAAYGAVVTVRSLYAALTSLSVPMDTVPATSGLLAAGTEGYGLCSGSEAGHSGVDPSVPLSALPDDTNGDFDLTCTSTDHNVGQLTTSAKHLWQTDGPTRNAYQSLLLKAAISVLTEAHDDYTDTLTFVMSATY